MMHFTVLGAGGFIGSHLVQHLRAAGHDCDTPERDADLRGRDLGIAVYAIGVTADFRSRPLDAIEAHAGRFREVVTTARYESMLYLSSTRLYRYGRETSEESPIVVRPLEADDVYAISKCMGESIAMTIAKRCKVARLSNVYGPDTGSENFLSSIIRDALAHGTVTLQTAMASAKDYIAVDEVCDLLTRIALTGRRNIYNVASGISTTHEDIAAVIQRNTGAMFQVSPQAPVIRDAPIDVSRIESEFGFRAANVTERLDPMIAAFRQAAVSR